MQVTLSTDLLRTSEAEQHRTTTGTLYLETNPVQSTITVRVFPADATHYIDKEELARAVAILTANTRGLKITP